MAEASRVVLLLAALARLGAALPLTPPLVAVERVPGLPDELHPALCPSKCKERFGAVPQHPPPHGKCACACPDSTPVFLTTDGVCVADVAECSHLVAFAPAHKQHKQNIKGLTIVRLPAAGRSVVNPRQPLQWREAGLNVSNACTVRAAYSDTVEHPWTLLESETPVFELETLEVGNVLKYIGGDEITQLLEGAAIKVELDCTSEGVNGACIAFRVAGRSELPSVRAVVAGSGSRSHLTVIIILCVLLVLSIIGSIVVYNVCWKMKKERLVQEIQMQFLAHFRQQHEDAVKAATMAAMNQQHAGFGVGHLQAPSSPHLSQSEFSPHSPQMQQAQSQKRKLYFSTDFFEPHLMANPPPIAEQFLFDLRKMIDVAKERIRMKRHIPNLPGIKEEEEGHSQDHSRHFQKQKPVFHCLQDESGIQDSPRSGKSVDSGHDSPEESSSSGSGDDDESKEMTTVATDTEGQGRVARLVNGFETTGSSKPQPSKIPTLSPKTPRQSLSASKNELEASQLPRSPHTNLSNGNTYKKTKNKGYAVFPVDSVLKKSLPRRPKRDSTSRQPMQTS